MIPEDPEEEDAMPAASSDHLSPSEELQNLKLIYGESQTGQLYKALTDAFNVLHNRAQTLLSLITLTLTITGFSGPRIAESGPLARFAIVFGIAFVLLSALILMVGPMRLRWSTQLRSDSTDESLVKLIEQRNARTARYHAASIALFVGLIGYVTSIISFLITG
jgi:hypothetical protein